MAARSVIVGCFLWSKKCYTPVKASQYFSWAGLHFKTKIEVGERYQAIVRRVIPSVRSFSCANRMRKQTANNESSHRELKCWKCGGTIPIEDKTYRYTCSRCQVLLPAELNLNYFAVLGFDITFDIDIVELSARYKELQKIFHPDRFSRKSAREQEFSASHSSQVNKAYQTLLKPLSRGVYLLELNSITLEEQDFDIEQTFLMEIMQKNEDLDESTSVEEITRLASENCACLEECINEASAAFKCQDFAKAKQVIAKLKYFDNIDGKAKEKLLQLKLQL